MRVFALASLIAFPLAMAQTAGAPTAGNLDQLASWMIGHYSSAEQAKADPEHFRDIRLEIARVWPSRKDGIWLYIEQAAATSLEKPYRQRIYHLTQVGANAFQSEIFEFNTDPLAFAGVWKQSQPLEHIAPKDLLAKKGCTVDLTFKGGQYVGGTQNKACESKLRGATYATTKVSITPTLLESWDQGWDAQEKQVWGAETGGYQFKKAVE